MKEVRVISDRDHIFNSIAEAYKNYPLFNYLVGNNCDTKPISQILSSSMKAIKVGTVGLTVGEKSEAVAIFIKPNYEGTAAIPFLFSGGIKLIFRYSLGIVLRLLNYEKYAMKMKKRYSDENCWYLYSLTVCPSCQKKGLATKVMRPMLDFFDSTNQGCYLETNKECNISMYEHFGFKLMERGTIPGTDVKHFAMYRAPRGNNG